MWNRNKKVRHKEQNTRIVLKLGARPFSYTAVARDDTGIPSMVDAVMDGVIPDLMIVRCPPTTCQSPGHMDVGRYQLNLMRSEPPKKARWDACRLK
jgi:hypothetical protein